MKRCLRIAVADDEPEVRSFFQAIIPLLGHEVVAAVGSGTELLHFKDLYYPPA